MAVNMIKNSSGHRVSPSGTIELLHVRAWADTEAEATAACQQNKPDEGKWKKLKEKFSKGEKRVTWEPK